MAKIPQERPDTPLLDKIDYPHQLKQLSKPQLSRLAEELRQFLLYSVGKSGGHLGAGLGVIELTIALHYVFDTPHDKLIWDVGHQSYPHKILTGRKDRMQTMRQKDGLAPFPSIEESEYDAFGTGHSSTSISAALGIAEATKHKGESHRTIAIVGDGAMTAGMAFEALNNTGDINSNLLVILNDNSMSISDNVGALSNFFGNFVGGKAYINLKELIKPGLEQIPKLRKLMHQSEEGLKHMFLPPSAFFETLGFNYTGILDGHDILKLISCLEGLSQVKGPNLLHIKTCKGKGLLEAEKDPIAYHALTKIEPQNKKKQDNPIKYTEVFSQWICDAAKKDESIVAITPAMREGSGLVEFSRLFPDRYYDVGIAEQHAVTMAGGMALRGLKPVVAIYSTFLQRAYDQFIHDIALQNLNIVFAIDRGGLVGEDGPTHHGNYDLSYLRCIPNVTIMAPADENELYLMLENSFSFAGVVAIRYPRGSATGIPLVKDGGIISRAKARVLRESGKGFTRPALLSFGSPTAAAKEIAEAGDLTLVDMRFVKPLDEDLILSYAKSYKRLVTIEDNVVAGGAGGAVLELLARQGVEAEVLCIGIADEFITHGTQAELRKLVGLDASAIRQKIQHRWRDALS